jgi:type II secretory pathway pseudopilin PulG
MKVQSDFHIGNWEMETGISTPGGYTLLELLIVISIMIIIFVIGFTNYRDYQRRQELESGVRQVRADLSLAQTYAITGRKPDSPSGNACETSPLNGYAFTRINPGNSYRIEADCGAGVRVVIKDNISMPSGIQITSVSGTPTDTLVFHVLGRGVDRVTPGDTTITIRSIATSATSQIVVTPSGEIK